MLDVEGLGQGYLIRASLIPTFESEKCATQCMKVLASAQKIKSMSHCKWRNDGPGWRKAIDFKKGRDLECIMCLNGILKDCSRGMWSCDKNVILLKNILKIIM